MLFKLLHIMAIEKAALNCKRGLLEPLQRNALKIAKDAADEFPELGFDDCRKCCKYKYL